MKQLSFILIFPFNLLLIHLSCRRIVDALIDIYMTSSPILP